jgi:3-mercaptopyruvate sulfurtransferase SseA
MLPTLLRRGAGVMVGLMLLGLNTAFPALANPRDYPQFAQQQVDTTVPLRFIKSKQVKQQLDAGVAQLLVDVRDAAHYAQGHLPGAISIPLQDFSARIAEIPRDIPVVLH